MKLKKLLASVTAAVMGLSVMAFAPAGGVSATNPLDSVTFGTSGWEYESVSGNTVTFSESWKGCGWWFGNDGNEFDLSAYDEIVVSFSNNTIAEGIKLVVQDTSAGIAESEMNKKTSGELVCKLDSIDKTKVMQAYIQNGSAGSVTVDSIIAKSSSGGSNEPAVTKDEWAKNSDGKWQYISSTDAAGKTLTLDVSKLTTADSADIKSITVALSVEGYANGCIGLNDATNVWTYANYDSSGEMSPKLTLKGVGNDDTGKPNLQVQLWWANANSTIIIDSIDIEADSSSDDPEPTTGVTVSVSPTSKSLKVGETATLTATVKGATDTSVTWKSSDESVATVADGVVTAVKAGTAKITVTSVEDSSASAACTVTVADESKPDPTPTPDPDEPTTKKTEINPVVKINGDVEVAENTTEEEKKAAVLEKAKVDEINGLVKDTDYTLDVKISGDTATVTFVLTEKGAEKYTIASGANIAAECKIIEKSEDPTPTVTYYTVTNNSSYAVSTSTSSITSGSKVSVSVLSGYYAVVTSNGSTIATIYGTGTFTMPSANVTIKAYADASYYFVAASYGKSYIRVYDGSEKVGTFKTKSEGTVNINLGSEYAGKTVNIYIGKDNTTDLYKTVELDENGKATVEVENSTNYNAVVE